MGGCCLTHRPPSYTPAYISYISYLSIFCNITWVHYNILVTLALSAVPVYIAVVNADNDRDKATRKVMRGAEGGLITSN